MTASTWTSVQYGDSIFFIYRDFGRRVALASSQLHAKSDWRHERHAIENRGMVPGDHNQLCSKDSWYYNPSKKAPITCSHEMQQSGASFIEHHHASLWSDLAYSARTLILPQTHTEGKLARSLNPSLHFHPYHAYQMQQ